MAAPAGGDRRRRLAVFLAGAVLVQACATPAPQRQAGPQCDYGRTAFDAAFPGGALDACRRTARRAFTLFIEPEGMPINPSPWYAFDIVSDQAQRLTITLDYGEFRHRYAPKMKLGNAPGWTPVESRLAAGSVTTQARFSVDAPAGVMRIAAQEVITLADEKAWVRDLATTTSFSEDTLGLSAEGRPVPSLSGGNAQSGTLVITGRQHPPEVTGAFALRAFVERLAADEPLAERFRRAFGVLVVPMLNPDGVARGHWRFDSNGTDLNRDWGAFRRPETRLVRDALRDLARRGASPVLILDFHSTQRDVLYTPSDDADIALAWFPRAWHAAINARVDGPPVARDAAHNPGNPTLKSWAPEAHGIPAITFEAGDDTPRERIDVVAAIAAEEAMRLLLEPSSRRAPR